MTAIHTTPATIAHIEPVRALVQSVLVTGGRFADTAQLERYLNRFYSPDSLKRTIENAGTHCLLATRGADVIGLIQFGSPLLEACTDRKEIHRLFSHPGESFDEVGGALVTSAVETLRPDSDVRQVFVYVTVGDTQLQTFYTNQQFKRDSTEDREDDLYLVRDL